MIERNGKVYDYYSNPEAPVTTPSVTTNPEVPVTTPSIPKHFTTPIVPKPTSTIVSPSGVDQTPKKISIKRKATASSTKKPLVFVFFFF